MDSPTAVALLYVPAIIYPSIIPENIKSTPLIIYFAKLSCILYGFGFEILNLKPV